MDELRPIEPEIEATEMLAPEPQADAYRHEDEPAMERPPEIGTDERRMHVRAYNFWVSMLGTRSYPSIEDLDPEHDADFGEHAVLLDFTSGVDNPAIAFLGRKLRHECAIEHDIETIADVPSRSLLSRLTDHYLQILANRAPIGFEAEFVSQRGHNTLYRGILMPFSSDDDTIDFVYGVINWKELMEPDLEAELVFQVEAAMNEAAAELPTSQQAPIWADGPGGGLQTEFAEILPGALDADPDNIEIVSPVMLPADADLADHLAAARFCAEAAHGAQLRSRSALYRALGLAYDFALVAEARPIDYAELIEDAGIKVQVRAPMTAIVKLVFGGDIDKARATEFAAALACARRMELPAGAFTPHVEGLIGGLKAMVAAERVARRPADAAPRHADLARAALRKVAPQIVIDLASDAGEFVLLLARRQDDGRLAVLAPVPAEDSLVDRAIRKITH